MGLFEAAIDTWIISFAEIQWEKGMCLTSQLIGPDRRLDAFVALAKLAGANEKWNKPLESFIKDVRGLSEQRNRAIHDVWDLSEAQKPIRMEATARKVFRRVDIHVPTDDLTKLEGQIVSLTERFDNDIAGAIFNELLPSLEKARLESHP